MTTILLLTFRSQEFTNAVEVALSEAFTKDRQPPDIVLATNETSAKAKLPGTIDLVVTPLHIPETTTIKESDNRGVELLKWIARNNMHIPSILIAPVRTPSLDDAILDLERCRLVTEERDPAEEIVSAAKVLVGTNGHRGPRKFLEIQVYLHLDPPGGFYELKGNGFPFSTGPRPLKVEKRQLLELSEYSKSLALSQSWEDTLKTVGEKLTEQLFIHNQEFALYVKEGIARSGGRREDSQVRFVVERALYSVPFEAVFYPQTKKYWMLQAPLYRRLALPATSSPLFENQADRREPINCLLIDSNVDGDVGDLGLTLEPLPNAAAECDELEALLEGIKQQFNIRQIGRVSSENLGESFAEQVRRKLEQETWHLVHYAGHSYFDEASGTGYVFFPGVGPGEIDNVAIEEFSGWLLNTQFIYFSSCDSSAEDFVFELADRQVPSILGFRWNIQDSLAAKYASFFYQHLFKEASLEIAFLRARQKMFRCDPHEPMWAAPMLIMQV